MQTRPGLSPGSKSLGICSLGQNTAAQGQRNSLGPPASSHPGSHREWNLDSEARLLAGLLQSVGSRRELIPFTRLYKGVGQGNGSHPGISPPGIKKYNAEKATHRVQGQIYTRRGADAKPLSSRLAIDRENQVRWRRTGSTCLRSGFAQSFVTSSNFTSTGFDRNLLGAAPFLSSAK